ncbi:MAG: hypothetical protein MUC50_13050 [Myxococcota bacterium]|jgi:hypothetical protein|nr:hypothetical protein [Myxococcota bacterium]
MLGRNYTALLFVLLSMAGCTFDFILNPDTDTQAGTGTGTGTERTDETQPDTDDTSVTATDGGTELDTNTATDSSCDGNGAAYQGICWYLGDYGQSCWQACASHGDYHPSTPEYVGTQAQGGSLEECTAILQALGYVAAVNSGMQAEGVGLGCHQWEDGTFWWLVQPDFDPAFSVLSAKRVCGCKG